MLNHPLVLNRAILIPMSTTCQLVDRYSIIFLFYHFFKLMRKSVRKRLVCKFCNAAVSVSKPYHNWLNKRTSQDVNLVENMLQASRPQEGKPCIKLQLCSRCINYKVPQINVTHLKVHIF